MPVEVYFSVMTASQVPKKFAQASPDISASAGTNFSVLSPSPTDQASMVRVKLPAALTAAKAAGISLAVIFSGM